MEYIMRGKGILPTALKSTMERGEIRVRIRLQDGKLHYKRRTWKQSNSGGNSGVWDLTVSREPGMMMINEKFYIVYYNEEQFVIF